MWILSLSIYLSLKWLTWWRARLRIAHAAWRSAAYLLAWPGMDAGTFLDARQHGSPPVVRAWLWATFETILGAILFWVVARSIPPGQPLLRGWAGMMGLILLLHFGGFQIVALLWQSLGVKAEPIMSAPLRSTSLAEFWGKRWNLGFRQLGHELIFRPLHRRLGAATAGFFVFVVSGLIHDLVISLPARGGYGLPTLYFLLQGAGVAVERSRFGQRLGLGHGARGWCFMMVFLVAPVFGLFHPWFVLRVILPFMRAVHAL
ncbi:MAG: MBOAT family protein [Candidatus Acidiferrales bacterium]